MNKSDLAKLIAEAESNIQALRELAEILGDRDAPDHMEDAIQELYEIFGIPTVYCALCGQECPEILAHLHQKQWIGDSCGCWDERMKASE
jgi:hypothetical protein